MDREFTVYIKETTVRPVVIVAETAAEAERIAENQYLHSDVVEVTFEAESKKN